MSKTGYCLKENDSLENILILDNVGGGNLLEAPEEDHNGAGGE